ncbi:hypothetical protein ACW5R3_06640 [Bizionia sp. KMM 8389]
MKTLKFLCLSLIVVFLSSCSSDDDNNTIESTTVLTNKIRVGESDFEIKTAIVEPSIGNTVFLSLTNSTEAEITAALNGTTFNHVDLFSARINALDLSPNTTYNLSEISSLEFVVDGDIIGSEFENGVTQFYLGDGTSDLRVVAGTITVADYDVETISLSFSFTRADGEEITGQYDGRCLFIDPSDE